jgi:hypothetical protein
MKRLTHPKNGVPKTSVLGTSDSRCRAEFRTAVVARRSGRCWRIRCRRATSGGSRSSVRSWAPQASTPAPPRRDRSRPLAQFETDPARRFELFVAGGDRARVPPGSRATRRSCPDPAFCPPSRSRIPPAVAISPSARLSISNCRISASPDAPSVARNTNSRLRSARSGYQVSASDSPAIWSAPGSAAKFQDERSPCMTLAD